MAGALTSDPGDDAGGGPNAGSNASPTEESGPRIEPEVTDLLFGRVELRVMESSEGDDGRGLLVVEDGEDSAAAARAFCAAHGLDEEPDYDTVLRRLVFAADKARAERAGSERLARLLRSAPRVDLVPGADPDAPLEVVSMRVETEGPGLPLTVQLLEGESPAAAAAAFARRHGSGRETAQRLAEALSAHMEAAGPRVLGTARLSLGGCPLDGGCGAEGPAHAVVDVRLWSHVPAATAAMRAFRQLGLEPMPEAEAEGAGSREGSGAAVGTLWTLREAEEAVSDAAEAAEAEYEDARSREAAGAEAEARRTSLAAGLADAATAPSAAAAGGGAVVGLLGSAGQADGGATRQRRRGEAAGDDGGDTGSRVARRGTGRAAAEAAAVEAASEAGGGGGRWVTASLMVAGQAFDLEFRLGSGGAAPDLMELGRGFCRREWDLLGPLMGPDPGQRQCAATVERLLLSRAQSTAPAA